jgi:hypothetical protein
MKQNWNAIKIITLVLLVLLMAAGFLTLLGGTRVLGFGGIPGQPGQFSGRRPEGMTPPEGGQFTPENGNGNWTPPSRSGTGQFDGNSNFQRGDMRNGQSSTQMKLLRLGQYALGGGTVLFSVLAIVGVCLNKKWAKVMTVIAGAIVLIAAAVSLFQMRSGITLIESIVKIVVSAGVIVLTFLPVKETKTEVKTE